MKRNKNSPIAALDMLDSMPGIVFWKSSDLKYSGANKTFLKLIGVESLDQLVGKKDDDMDWPKYYKDYFSQHDHSIVSSGKPMFSMQTNILAASDHEIVTIITDKYPIYDENKNVVGILGISSVIYDQQLNSQTYLQNLIEIIPYFIFWKNTDLVYLGCNKKFAKLVGKESPRDVIGKTDFDLGWSKSEAETYQMGDRKTMSGSPTINAEEIVIRPDGTEIIMLVNKVPLLGKTGDCIGVLGTSVDITERKKTEEALKEAKVAAEKMQVMKTLAASIAHELRTPLRTIASAAGGIKKYYPILLEAYTVALKEKLAVQRIDPSHYKTLLPACGLIESEADEAFTIINMLLTNLSETTNTADIKLETCSIQFCINEAVRRYPFDLGEKELVDYQNVKDFTFKGNQLLVIHILFNLLKNALYQIKAANKGEITIWTQVDKNFNLLHFKDTAKGISSEILPHIFDQFFTRTYHGTGIGLAFCKMVMERIGGRIQCESKEGEYAEFVLYFPLWPISGTEDSSV